MFMILKRFINSLKGKNRYSDTILKEYDELRKDNSPTDIMCNALSMIIKSNDYINNHYIRVEGSRYRQPAWGDDSDELIKQKIADARYNIYENTCLFELAINEYFNTSGITCEVSKYSSFHVYDSLFMSVSDKSSEYLILKENLQRCKLDNGCGARLTYHPNLFDFSLI